MGNQSLQILLEKNTLGYLLSAGKSHDTNIVYKAIAEIEPSYFTEDKHKIIYEVIVSTVIKKKSLDMMVFFMSLNSTGKLEMAGGADYIAELISKRESTTNLLRATNQLKNEHKRREIHRVCEETIASLQEEESVENILDSLDSTLYAIRDDKDTNTIVDIPLTTDIIIEKANRVETLGCYGYSWGLPKLDYITGGIESGKTYVVGATKKSGKTKFVINTIHALHEKGVRSLFLSLEMNGEAVVKELISRFKEINNSDLKRNLSEQTFHKIKSFQSSISNIEIDTEAFLNILQLRYKVRHASQMGVKVVFIDYLQRMDFQQRGTALNFATLVSQAVAQIADIAKEFNVAIVFLSQLANRVDSEQASIADLKDSGGIAEGVDCILILNNQDRIKKEYERKTNEIWISIEQRSGSSGMIKCIVDLSISKYVEM